MLNQNRFCFIPSSNTTGAVSTLMSNDSMASGSSNRADPVSSKSLKRSNVLNIAYDLYTQKSMTQEALAAEVKKKNASGTKKKIPVLTSKKTRIVPSPKSSKTSGSSNSAETVDLTLAETSPSAGVDKDMINVSPSFKTGRKHNRTIFSHRIWLTMLKLLLLSIQQLRF